ncbi:hypothetical protein [Stappia sp. WLB 29]|uniref:hypothetical protein n=1 Tax=Stappia sp. WLB 29 TaxID=2925220 RepID=UPI0020BFC295|nr:hypothetical protein [Stappia sp. WLB 29]
MLLKREVLEGIRAGRVSLQFRRWRRRTVKPGGTLRTAIGVLAIGDISPVEAGAVTDDDARAAGFTDAAALRDWLDDGRPGMLERIEVSWAGEDPRAGLREEESLDPLALAEIAGRLDAMDGRAREGAWTARAMDLIARNPERPAAELAAAMGLEKLSFKTRIRRLKALGLTESLATGYRLSPRGARVHAFRSART